MSRLAISVLAYRDEQEAVVLSLLARHGIRGLETAPSRVADPAGYARAWQDRGITLCAMQSLFYGAPPCALFETDALRTQMLTNLEAACALAQRLGIRTLVFGASGQRRRGTLSHEQAFAQATAFFRRAAAVAAHHATVLCLEAVPAEHGCDFITSTREAAELVETVNHPALALHFDVGTCALAGEDPAVVTRRYHHQIRHCHVSELQLRPVGTQGVDHERMAAALHSISYTGWVSLEMFATDAPERDLDGALATVRQQYGNL